MITDTITPYEILIRHSEDGAFQGAQIQYMRVIKDVLPSSETVIARQILEAQPLTADSDPAFETVLGAALAEALVANAELQAQVIALQFKRDEQATEIATLQAQVQANA